MRSIIVIAHNLRSAHNVGSLLRTSEGLGVGKIWLSGYSPYPQRENRENDPRLPHIAQKVDRQIAKTALGAEKLINWQHETDINKVFAELKKQGFMVAAVEQAPGSIKLPEFKPPPKLALVFGREVEGLEPEVRAACDFTLEIPMFGQKESFNVAAAAAITLYHCRFQPGR